MQLPYLLHSLLFTSPITITTPILVQHHCPAVAQQNTTPAFISSPTSLSNGNSPGTSSSHSKTQVSGSNATCSPNYATPNFMSQPTFLASLNLVFDFFSYPLQQPSSSDLHATLSVICQHPMVLYPRLPKTTHLTAFSASTTSPSSRVITPPVYEPISFSDADRYEAWHNSMKARLQALSSNDT
jgi:hypothetical protein